MNVRDGWWLFKAPKDCERLMILAAILTLVLSPQVAAAAPQTSPIVRLESHRGDLPRVTTWKSAFTFWPNSKVTRRGASA